MRDIAKKLVDIHTKGAETVPAVVPGAKPESGVGAGAGVKSEEQRLRERYPSMSK